jgi:NAD(P)-dependent dehydrogenase (short-subunit alcohol dehydrogenase family)
MEEQHETAAARPRLAGRRIVVVGAGTRILEGMEGAVGNGQAIARQAAAEGAKVACVDRSREAAEATAAKIGDAAAVIEADVSDPDACTRLVDEAAEAMGGLDGVVLGVGILGPHGLDATTPEAWDRLWTVNARAHGLITTAALKRMEAGSSFVFVSSISAWMPGIGIPAYDATKAASAAIMRIAAVEGARKGIRANAVAPGVVDTPLGAASAPPGKRDRGRIPLPLGRPGSPWDIAKAACFLLSDEASYVTAHTLVVDGGVSTIAAAV